jgi:hypothetical protein
MSPSDSNYLERRGTAGEGLYRLEEVQRLPTSGARAVALRTTSADVLLGVAQLAVDIAGQAPGMHAGNSDAPSILYQWRAGRFVETDRVPLPGGEHLEFFEIGGRRFLAGASLRSGSGPYEMDIFSPIYEEVHGRWTRMQSVATFGAKQWHYFSIGTRHFLALAQGVDVPGLTPRHPRTACLLEWDGQAFVNRQTFPGRWGYGWQAFSLQGNDFLAYADHLEQSVLYRWSGDRFEEFQTFPGGGGRAFRFFNAAGSAWLGFANLQQGTGIHRWDGKRFVPHQLLGGPGARALTLLTGEQGLYLINVNFIQGTPAAPRHVPHSQLYLWAGDSFESCENVATSAATDVAAFKADGAQYVVIANSLDAQWRFRTDTVVYRFRG